MNSSPELSNTNSSENGANMWDDILPKDNFYQHMQSSEEAPKSEKSDEEIRQILLAKKRSEQLKNNAEAKKHATRVVAGFLAIMITVAASIGGLIATGPKKDILKSDQARKNIHEMENVEEIDFYGGNIRSNPEIPNSEDPSNTYASMDDGAKIEVSEDSKILYYSNDKDPNGGWIGIPAKELKNKSFISEKMADKIEKAENQDNGGDDYIWINRNNASTITGPENNTP